MIIKKIIPLMGISVLLLLVNLPQADADLCGDTIFLRVLNDDTGAEVFNDSDVVPGGFANNIQIAPFVQIDVQVNCDSDGDGISTIFFDYVTPPTGPDPFPVPNHSFWFTDLDWTNEAGEVVDFTVDPGAATTSLMTTGFGPHEAHAFTGAFSINAGTSMLNDLILTAQHNGDNGGIAIGGEFVPMSTSALLLAGAQNSMAWMIPLMVAVAGFGIVISRKL